MRPHHTHPQPRASPERRQPSPDRRSRVSRPSPSRDMRADMRDMRRPHPEAMGPHQLGPPYYPGPGHEPPHGEEGPTPICRCRVLYLGSSVPHVTKDGLQGIQEPLKELYPEDGALGAKGIDSWLSVWSNGFLLENVDENRKKVSRFFPIDSLHYCAAVRYVQVPGTSGEKVQRFLPLDSPFARNPNINHPPLFAAILRRTTGIKVLECHVFICKRETAANALVRCSFHAYADSTYAKHLENGASLYGTVGAQTPVPGNGSFQGPGNGEVPREFQQSVMEMSDDSITSIDPSLQSPHEWAGPGGVSGGGGHFLHSTANMTNMNTSPQAREQRGASNGVYNTTQENGNGNADGISVYNNGDENHKVWAQHQKEADMTDGIYGDYGSTMRSFRSSASGLSTRNRPRQMMMQSPPPPPIPEELVNKEGKEERKKKKKSKSRDAVDGEMPPLLNGSVTNLNGGPSNGSVINGGRASSVIGGRKMSAGSFIGINPNGRPPMNGGPPRGMPPMGPYGPPPGPGYGPPPPMMMMPGPGPRGKKGGTFSGRQKGMRGPPPMMMYGPPGPHMMPPGPMPPHLMPPPGHPLHQQMMMAGGSQVMEEPIYMPHNARPLSPVASYQPGHFPHDAYYSQQQYATIDKNGKYRTRGERKSKGGRHSKQQSSAESNAEDSEGTGIYKKGYINERAFAHSMRNEHRSRSYGSLANLQFDPNGEVIGPGEDQGPEEMLNDRKKIPRDMMHMMDNLDLDNDAIERSEVPANFYPPPRAHRGHGGHGPGLPPPHPHVNGVAGGHTRRHRR